MKPLTRDSIRIIHVDDDDDFAVLSARGLRRAGFSQPIVRWMDGLSALQNFPMIEPDSAPHVILLDLNMPGKNGLEVLHWIRENYRERNVAVYLLTSSENPEDRRQARAEGVTEYVLKASQHDQLIEKLDGLISLINEKSQAHKESVLTS